MSQLEARDVGAFILKKRKEKNMTQKNLAALLCVSDKAVSKWENGECFPEITLLPELAVILECSVDEILHSKTVRIVEENSYSTPDNKSLAIKKTKAKFNRKKRLAVICLIASVFLLLAAIITPAVLLSSKSYGMGKTVKTDYSEITVRSVEYTQKIGIYNPIYLEDDEMFVVIKISFVNNYKASRYISASSFVYENEYGRSSTQAAEAYSVYASEILKNTIYEPGEGNTFYMILKAGKSVRKHKIYYQETLCLTDFGTGREKAVYTFKLPDNNVF